MPHASLAELQAKIAKHAWEDPAFEAEFMANPKGTFEKYTGQTLPGELQIHAHYNTPTELHFTIPKRVGGESGELSDEDLERVAGGEVVTIAIVVVSLVLSAAGSVAVGVAANNGWDW